MKLQVLNLAVKLYLTNAEQTELLCQYLFSLARYDENYDIRDRARFLKPFIFPQNDKPTILSRNAKKIFLAQKPAPLLESKYKGREQFQLGSLSHYLNIKANGYHDLPPFPKNAPDSSVRGVDNSANEPSNNTEQNENSDWSDKPTKSSKKPNKKNESFYSESENESSNDGSSDSEEDSSDDSGESDDESSSGEEESEENESDTSESENDSSSDASTSSDDEESSSSSDHEVKNHNPSKVNNEKPKETAKKAERSNLDLLLELDDIASSGPIMTPSLGGFLTPSTQMVSTSRFELVGPNYISVEKRELLNKVHSHGLQIDYRFTRAPHLYSAKMISLELTFRNDSHNELENIHISDKSSLPAGVSLNEFAPIAKLNPGQSSQGILGIDFNDSTQSITFEVTSSVGSARVSIKSTVGELIRAVRITEQVFKEEQSRLRGMNEHSSTFGMKHNLKTVQKSIFETANLALVSKGETDGKEIILFAGQTMASQSLVLVTLETLAADKLSITVNCEKMVVGSMLLNEIKNFIKC